MYVAELTTAVLCSVPLCTQPRADNTQFYCLEHATPRHTTLPVSSGHENDMTERYTCNI